MGQGKPLTVEEQLKKPPKSAGMTMPPGKFTPASPPKVKNTSAQPSGPTPPAAKPTGDVPTHKTNTEGMAF